jgi:hypothetical protein
LHLKNHNHSCLSSIVFSIHGPERDEGREGFLGEEQREVGGRVEADDEIDAELHQVRSLLLGEMHLADHVGDGGGHEGGTKAAAATARRHGVLQRRVGIVGRAPSFEAMALFCSFRERLMRNSVRGFRKGKDKKKRNTGFNYLPECPYGVQMHRRIIM